MEDAQLEQKLQEIKDMMDEAYDTTKNKYTEEDAINAIVNYFINYKTNSFTRDNNARENMESLLYRPNEFSQILLDYAISSCILNNLPCNITNEEINRYTNDREGKLDYSGTRPIQIMAIAVGMNTYWASNLLAVNRRLRRELIFNFINERYIQNKRKQLDAIRKIKIVKIEGYPRNILMSKSRLNNDIRNMNHDDAYEEYIIPNRKR